jgi:hypothetical protein
MALERSPSHLVAATLFVGAMAACGACNAGTAGTGFPEGGLVGSDPGSSGSSGSSGGDGATGDGGAHPHPGGDAGDGGTPSNDDAIIDLTFGEDCSPVFDDVRVTTNVVAYDSIGVTNAYAPLSGSVQVALTVDAPETFVLSTTQRTQSSNAVVINVLAGGTTYTNLCSSSASGCHYDATSSTWLDDPVSGTFVVNTYDPQHGKLDVAFTNVTLQAAGGSALCKVNGTLVTKRLSQ